jgi:hypothetical protein
MRLFHARRAVSVRFDDPNLVSCAGLAAVVALAARCGLGGLVPNRIRIGAKGGANAAAKIVALVVGMVAGADSINDMDLLRHGGMGRLFDEVQAPSTLGPVLRLFTFGHIRQLDAVAAGSRLLSITATGEGTLTAAPATGVGGHGLQLQMPDYYTQRSDSGAQALMAHDDDDELGQMPRGGRRSTPGGCGPRIRCRFPARRLPYAQRSSGPGQGLDHEHVVGVLSPTSKTAWCVVVGFRRMVAEDSEGGGPQGGLPVIPSPLRAA